MATRHIVGNHYPSYKPIGMSKKKSILKKACGKGGPGMPLDPSMMGGAPPMGAPAGMPPGMPPGGAPPMPPPPAPMMSKPKMKTPSVGFLPHKKSIKHKLKSKHKVKSSAKHTGKGGLQDSLASGLDTIGKSIKKGISMSANSVGNAIRGYKDFAARDKALNDEASRQIGKVSSNAANMDEMMRIKHKLKKEGFASTTKAQ